MSRRIRLLLTLASALLLVWLSAPTWLGWLLRSQLQQAGFQHVICDIERVGLGHIHIRRLSARRNHARFSMEATQITAQYQLTTVLLQQRITTLHIHQLTMAVGSSTTAETGGSLIMLPQLALWQQLPFEQASIDTLRLQHLNHQLQPDVELTGHARYTRHRIEMQLQDQAATQTARLSLDHNGAFTLALQHEQQSALRMRGHISSRQQQLHMDAKLHIDLAHINALLLRWGWQLDLQPVGSIDITGHASLPPDQPLNQKLLEQISAKADLHLQGSLLNASAGIDMSGQLELSKGQGRWKILDGSSMYLGQHETPITLTTHRLAGSFLLTAPQLKLQPSSHLDIQHLIWNGWQIPQADITLLRELHITATDSGAWLQPVELQLGIPAMRRNTSSLALPDIRLQFHSNQSGELQGQLHTRHITLTTHQGKLTLDNMQVKFRHKQQQLRAQWQTDLAPRLVHIHGDLLINTQHASGQLHYRTDKINIRQRQAAMHAWLTAWMPQLTLQEGYIRAFGDIRWQTDHLSAQTRLQLDALNGSWQQQTFHNLQTSCHLRYDGQRVTVQAEEITLARLQGAIPIQQIHMQLNASWTPDNIPAITIRNFSARLLGGKARAVNIILLPERAQNPFTIQLEHIDLAEVIALEQQQGLQIQGYLSGTLPLDVTPEGLYLRHGTLHAIPPGGIIRYRGSTSVQQMAASNMGVDLALQVLSDFRYQRMDVQADYVPKGILTLAVQLKGHNPSYEHGRPIMFNLNIEENVLQLIKSLQLAGNIEKNVRKKLHRE